MSLVPAESPLRLVPTSLSRKEVLFVDGIRYSLHIIDVVSNRLANALGNLGQSDTEPNALADRIAEAISDAWLLIDACHRLRELLQQVPKLKKNELPLQLFLRRTASVEDLRHLVQHFRSRIDSLAGLGLPLWGSLSWIYTNRESGKTENFTIAPGTFFHGAKIPTCTFNSVEGKYVERVVLYAGSLKIDLADLVDHVTEFAAWYSKWFRQTHSSSDHHAADIFIQLAVTPVHLSQSEAPNAPPAPK